MRTRKASDSWVGDDSGAPRSSLLTCKLPTRLDKSCVALSSSITVFGSPHFSDLERVLNLNLGQEEEFSPLQGQCFEYTDRE